MTVTETLRTHARRAADETSIRAVALAAGVSYASTYKFIADGGDLNGSSIDALAKHLGLVLTAKRKRK